jgi:Icc-related predicted phosphoesterase
MKITCVSDLHGHYPDLDAGDLLIIAGDLTKDDFPSDYNRFSDWCAKVPFEKVIVTFGNHDNFLQKKPQYFNFMLPKVESLLDSGTEFCGLKIWGSPWTKSFPGMNPHCKAFTVDTEEELSAKFSSIPENTDILVTHSPPYGILDVVEDWTNLLNVGSHSLLKRVNEVAPRLNVFGHIHEGYGEMSDGETTFINASQVDIRYRPINKPINIEIL